MGKHRRPWSPVTEMGGGVDMVPRVGPATGAPSGAAVATTPVQCEARGRRGMRVFWTSRGDVAASE